MKQFIKFGFVLLQISFISCSIFDDYDYDNYNDIDNYDYQQNYQQPYIQTYQNPAVQGLPYPFLKESQNYFIQPSQYADQQGYNSYLQTNNVEPDSLESESYEDSDEDQTQQGMEQTNIRRRRSPSIIPYVKRNTAVSRNKRQSEWIISACTREECRNRGDGWRGLEQCGPAYCTCSNGHAYLQGCGFGLIYHAEKRLCTWYYNVPGC